MLRSPGVVDIPGARYVIDYALARRSVLTGLASGRVRREDACDADNYLKRAARYHGEPVDEVCPVCADETLVHVTYAYGDCFSADTNGRAWSSRELPDLALRLPEFSVYVVEVCRNCGWNHLVTSAVLGTGEPMRRRRRSASSGGGSRA
ncbi:MAG TPA: DUF5318 family protein [Mycobacteriales bacterium]|nr:DUF5318 family protein [Mycobacteriales bacterium]